MLREYPELAEFDEFTSIRNDELIFVWNLLFDSSAIDNPSDSDKRKSAAKKAFSGDKEKVALFTSGKYAPEIKAAIECMETFNPSARMRAKYMIDKIFYDFENIVKKDFTVLTDVSEAKKWSDLKLDIIKSLPGLIKQIERGYGVVEEKEKKESKERGTTFADSIHEFMNKEN